MTKKFEKIFIIGPPFAGKSTFIETISELAVSSEGGEAFGLTGWKKSIAVGLTTIDEETKFCLLSHSDSPDLNWNIWQSEMLGYIFMFHSVWLNEVRIRELDTGNFVPEIQEVITDRRERYIGYVKQILGFLREQVPSSFVIAANQQDKPEALPLEQIRQLLGLNENEKLLPCVANDKESVKSVLLELLNFAPQKPMAAHISDLIREK